MGPPAEASEAGHECQSGGAWGNCPTWSFNVQAWTTGGLNAHFAAGLMARLLNMPILHNHGGGDVPRVQEQGQVALNH